MEKLFVFHDVFLVFIVTNAFAVENEMHDVICEFPRSDGIFSRRSPFPCAHDGADMIVRERIEFYANVFL